MYKRVFVILLVLSLLLPILVSASKVKNHKRWDTGAVFTPLPTTIPTLTPIPTPVVFKKPQSVQFMDNSNNSGNDINFGSGNLTLSLLPFVYNSIYSIHNMNDPEHSINVLRQFEYLICAEPGELAEKELIVANAIKDTVKIFGYINLGGSPLPKLSQLKIQMNRMKEHGWYGVFIDQFGYDFGETRKRQNAVIDYAHSLGLTCFINAWFIDDAFGAKVDNIHNPEGLSTSAGEGDWYLMESYYTQTSGYTEHPSDFFTKCKKAQEYKDKLKINIACLSYKRKDLLWDKTSEDIQNSYLTSLLFGFDGWWYTDRLEDDGFQHGDPKFVLGDTLVSALKEVIPGFYLAETNRYVFLYDFRNFTTPKLEAFDPVDKESLINYLLYGEVTK